MVYHYGINLTQSDECEFSWVCPECQSWPDEFESEAEAVWSFLFREDSHHSRCPVPDRYRTDPEAAPPALLEKAHEYQ